MKVNYSSLKCPHCGAKDFFLVGDDVFLCEYCKEKFNFNIDDITFDNANKVFVEELKQQFYDKINSLYDKIKEDKTKLNYYNKLAYPKLLKVLSFVCLLISLIFWTVYPVFTFISATISVVFIIFSFYHANKRYKKYHPKAALFARKIVEHEYHINYYSKLISKLTK